MVSKLTSDTRLYDLVDPVIEAISRTHPFCSQLMPKLDQDLESFVQGFFSVHPPSIQDRSDFTEQMVRCVRAAQGDVVAERTRARLQRSPVINTANHMSLECLPLTVQSMIIAAFGEEPDGILPVNTCVIIPADNICYPTGLLLARQKDGKPLRIPLLNLSQKQRRQVTWMLEPFTKEDLSRATAQVSALLQEGIIFPAESKALSRVLNEVLGAPEILERSSFRDQVSMAVPRSWDTWFTPEARRTMPALTYTPFDCVSIPLLVRDLQDSGSFISRVLFDPALRGKVVANLDGLPGCWSDGGRKGGSALFWQIDQDRRTRPLYLEPRCLSAMNGTRIPLEAAALTDALAEGSLMPTTCLNLTLLMARGLVQVGGFMQIEYLAAIQNGLSRALTACGYGDWAERLSGQIPPMLTAGLTAVVVEYGKGALQSAGSIELMAHGGLSLPELNRMRKLSIREALARGLPEIARILGSDVRTLSGWKDPAVVLAERPLCFRL